MESPILSRLFQSFDELEEAMNSARATLKKKGADPSLFVRLDSYDEMITKQRTLANEVAEIIKNEGSLEEIGRRVKLINGLSTMIKEDAREILKEILKDDLK